MPNNNSMTHADLRAICTDHALSIRESQVDMDAPIFVEEVIEDAEKLFQYILKGTKPKQMKVSPTTTSFPCMYSRTAHWWAKSWLHTLRHLPLKYRSHRNLVQRCSLKASYI
jgi:hypothetical protein